MWDRVPRIWLLEWKLCVFLILVDITGYLFLGVVTNLIFTGNIWQHIFPSIVLAMDVSFLYLPNINSEGIAHIYFNLHFTNYYWFWTLSFSVNHFLNILAWFTVFIPTLWSLFVWYRYEYISYIDLNIFPMIATLMFSINGYFAIQKKNPIFM